MPRLDSQRLFQMYVMSGVPGFIYFFKFYLSLQCAAGIENHWSWVTGDEESVR